MNLRLTKEIKRRGLLRKWIAEQVGIDPTLLSKIERGSRSGSPAIRERIAAVFNLPVEDLFSEENDAA